MNLFVVWGLGSLGIRVVKEELKECRMLLKILESLMTFHTSSPMIEQHA
jgi:hypothetical protein